MRGLNFHHLRYFRAVAHEGNLTRTAERLNVSQSALSSQIRQLEERLGHALFERRGRALHLTEAGRIALDYADAIFSTGEELVGTLKATGQARQAVRIGALATLSRNFQIGFLRPILGRPDVEVILRSGNAAELLDGLETLNFDLVLTSHPPASDAAAQFLSHRLAEQRVSLVGTPACLEEGGSVADLLGSKPLILPHHGTARSGFNALADRLGIRPQIAAEVDDVAMMRLLAREGVGLAVLPPIAVKDELESGLLVEVDRLPGIAEHFYAVTVKRKFPNPLIDVLLASAESSSS